MDLAPELAQLLARLDADPDAGLALLEQHAPMLADTLAKRAWAEGHECGEEDGRNYDHPQAVGCYTNPYEDSLLRRTVDRRFIGVVDGGDEVRHILIRGTVPATSEDHKVLNEAMRREGMRDWDWRWTRQEVRNLIPGQPGDLGALLTTKGEVWVEPAFADAQPDDTVTVVTLTLRDRAPSPQYARYEAPRPRLGRIPGRHLGRF